MSLPIFPAFGMTLSVVSIPSLLTGLEQQLQELSRQAVSSATAPKPSEEDYASVVTQLRYVDASTAVQLACAS